MNGGYGEIDAIALNVQDIAALKYVPVFLISRRDEVIFPHEASMNNIKYLTQAKLYLDKGKIREALLEK